MIRDFVKINEEDLAYAEDFFQNEKHFNEWLINVFNYYRGKEIKIKTKIVQKYFNNYKKTMDFILNSIDKGKKGQSVKAEKQAVKQKTLEGVFKPSLEPSLEPNNKVISNNNKVISLFSFKQSLIDYGFNEQLISDWLKVRKAKKASNTETAYKNFIGEIEKRECDINNILEFIVSKSWSGFKWEWYDKEKPNINYTQKKYTDEQIRRAKNYWTMDGILPADFDKNDLHLLK